MALKIIAALSENNVIGVENRLPWKLPDDMGWFREKTGTSPVLMGRKTFDSLPEKFRPLPNRENIVLTHEPDHIAGAVTKIDRLRPTLERAKREDIWVIGGGQVYRLLLPFASEMCLTRVEASFEGDAFFPDWSRKEWELVSCQYHFQDARHAHRFSWQVWRRK